MHNMRSTLLGTTLLGLVLATGCTVGDSGGSSDGTSGDGTGDGAGDGVSVDAAPVVPDPTLSLSVDKPTVNTELAASSMVTLTITGGDGFQGLANVTATAVDAAGAPLVGWDVTLSAPSVTLASNGSGTVVATLKTPSETSSLTGSIKLDVTSAAAPATVTSAVTVANQISLSVNLNGQTCVYPTVNTAKVKIGTKVRLVNAATAGNVIFHVDGGGTGMVHQQGAGTTPGTAYEEVVTDPGTATWYCHDRNQVNQRLTVE